MSPVTQAQSSKIENFENVIGKFTAHYSGKYDDQMVVTEEEREKRKENVGEVVDSYYNFATQAYEANWSQHFHYSPIPPSYPPSTSTLATAHSFYAHKLALTLGLCPGMKVLDVGCGIGGPAREIARFVGCEVVGVTINQGQVDRAILVTAMEGLSGRCTFVQANFLDLPFGDGGFDAAYAIEATAHAPSLERVFREVRRVLKPGGRFLSAEWVMTGNFDPENEKHLGIRNRIERGNALVNLHTLAQARDAFVRTRFVVESERDFMQEFESVRILVEQNSRTMSETEQASEAVKSQSPVLVPFRTGLAPASSSSTPLPNPLPLPPTTFRHWTWPLEGHHHLATTWTDWWTASKTSPFMRKSGYAMIRLGEKIGLWDKGVLQAMETMAVCVDSVVEGRREGIFTPGWWFLACKVEDEAPNASLDNL